MMMTDAFQTRPRRRRRVRVTGIAGIVSTGMLPRSDWKYRGDTAASIDEITALKMQHPRRSVNGRRGVEMEYGIFRPLAKDTILTLRRRRVAIERPIVRPILDQRRVMARLARAGKGSGA